MSAVVRRQLAQALRLTVNDRARLSVRLQVPLIARDNVPPLGGFGVGCGCQQQFEAAENLVGVLNARRVLLETHDTDIGDHPDHG